jgi:hypothetical protein
MAHRSCPRLATDSDHRLLDIGKSALFFTSTWLPPNLDAMFSTSVLAGSADPELFPGNHNDSLFVGEVNLGGYSGQVDIERLRSLVELMHTRKSDSPKKETRPSVLQGLPRVVASLAVDQGRFGLGGSPSSASTNWKPSDTLCLSLPSVNFSTETRYVELIHKHSDAQRRKTRRLWRKGRRTSHVPSILEDVLPHKTASNEESPSSDGDDPTSPSSGSDGKTPPPLLAPVASPPPYLRLSSFDIHPQDQNTFSYQVQVFLGVTTFEGFLLSEKDSENVSGERGSDKSVRHNIWWLGPTECSLSAEFLGCEKFDPSTSVGMPVVERQVDSGLFNGAFGDVGIDLWKPDVITALRRTMDAVVDTSTPPEEPIRSSEPQTDDTSSAPLRPIVDALPHDILVHAAIGLISVRLASPDQKSDPGISRGAAFECRQIICEYLLQTLPNSASGFAARQRLDLPEDIVLQANSLKSRHPSEKFALFKVIVLEAKAEPVVNAAQALQIVRSTSEDVRKEVPPTDWELKNRASMIDFVKPPTGNRTTNRLPDELIFIPNITFRVTISSRSNVNSNSNDPIDDVTIAADVNRLTSRINMFRLYCTFLTAFTFHNLFPPRRHRPSQPAGQPSAKRRLPPSISIRAEIGHVHILATLPSDVRLFFQFRRLELQVSSLTKMSVLFDTAMMAGESPTVPEFWDDIIRLRSLHATAVPSSEGWKDPVIRIDAQAGRLRIPYGYHLSSIIDNLVTMVKATKQLVHRLLKGRDDWIIEPGPEKAKRVPHVSIAISTLALEMEDDPLETALNRIWRVGREEQKGRLARDYAFEKKAESTEKAAQEGKQGLEGHDADNKPHHHPRASIPEAREALDRFNSRNWIDRARNAKAEQRRREEGLLRKIYGRPSHRPDVDLPIDLTNVVPTAPLFRATFNSVDVDINKPSFGLEGVTDFLHEVGKGLPRDAQFSLLIPFHISWTMNEAKVALRDYPLPLLHIPPPLSGQDDVKSWELETDLVIAEEAADSPSSVRRVPCVIVPPEHSRRGHTILVPRSAMPTKTYALPRVRVQSPHATRIGWGNSIQPTIQDVARVFETVTKQTPDPSERVGFWDKVRLIMHGNVEIDFPGNSEVHLHLKGERDPYSITGKGSGFCMCWRDEVRILLGFENRDREFLQVESDEFILGIPDLRDYEDNAATGLSKELSSEGDDKSVRSSTHDTESHVTSRRFRRDALFIKVAAKFINGVRWGMGIVLERSCRPWDCQRGCKGPPFNRQCRFFDFIPHWEVKTKTRDGLKDPDTVSCFSCVRCIVPPNVGVSA